MKTKKLIPVGDHHVNPDCSGGAMRCVHAPLKTANNPKKPAVRTRIVVALSISAVALAAFAGPATGQSIGIDFSALGGGSGGAGNTPLASGSVAGFVPQANWNNLPATSGTIDGVTTFVNDSTGAPVAGLAVSWSSEGCTSYGGAMGAFTSANDPNYVGDTDLYSSLAFGASFTLTGIPYSNYDIYVYFAGGSYANYPATYAGYGVVNIDGPLESGTYWGGDNFSVQGEYLPGNGFVAAAPGNPPDYTNTAAFGAPANYAVATNLTGSNATIGGEFDGYWYGGITAVQIVPVPPPAAERDINLTGYTKTFDDEFNSLSVTTNSPMAPYTWYYWPPYGAAGAYSDSEWNIDSFSVSDGILTDTAFWTTTSGTSGYWSSGNLSSMDPTGAGFAQLYGYFEIRCQMPDAGEGAWPAFWLDSDSNIAALDSTATTLEEIDIFEWYGMSYQNPIGDVSEGSHNWGSGPAAPYVYEPGVAMPDGSQPWQGYHIYGCQIDPAHVTWYIDGVETNQMDTPTAYLTGPFYIMIDYALGGGWPLSGSPFTTNGNSSLLVDWVRVYALPVVTPNENAISIDFAGSNTSQQLQPSNVAGTLNSGSNWNVFTGTSKSTPTVLVNAAGSTQAGVTLSSFSASTDAIIDSGTGLTPDQELFASDIQATSASTVKATVSAIPYSSYNLLVYIESGTSGRTGSVSVSGTSTEYYYSTIGGSSQPASYIQVTSTTAGTYTTGNYAVFTGLSGTGQTITLSPTSSGGGPGGGGGGHSSKSSGICGIQITPPQTQLTYVQWSDLYFTTQQLANTAITGDAATPENDGVSNLLKFLCDINPNVPMNASAMAALPAGGMTTLSGTTYLTMTYRQSQWATGLTVNVQTSPDLQNWTTATPGSIVTTGTDPATNDPLVQYQVPVSPPGASEEFIRLNVTGP